MPRKRSQRPQDSKPPKAQRLAPLWRALIETGFIIFLFYANLLMGEYTRSSTASSNHGAGKSLAVALGDIFTATNFTIAVISALAGYGIVEFLRKRL